MINGAGVSLNNFLVRLWCGSWKLISVCDLLGNADAVVMCHIHIGRYAKM